MTEKYEKEDDEEYDDEEVSSESEEEYEDEAEGAEASDEPAGEESEDSVASWGYEEKKSRFSKEMLAGFAAIGVLVSIFGIVVYKKFPGADTSAEVATAGPEASLGNPEAGSQGADPNDPFAEGAGDGLGPQSEPGIGGGNSGELIVGGNTSDLTSPGSGTTTFAPNGNATETASLFPETTSSNRTVSSDPFAGNSETANLFPGQSEPASSSETVDPFETSPKTDQFGQPLSGPEFGSLADKSKPAMNDRRNVFGGASSEFADSGRADPFATPDLSGNSASRTTGSLDSLGTAANTGAGSSLDDPGLTTGTGGSLTDPFLTGNELAQNKPKSGGKPDNSGSQPFGTTIDATLSNDPFGATVDAGISKPGGLFDREPIKPNSSGGSKNPSATSLASDPGVSSKPSIDIDFGDSQPASTGIEFGTADSNGSGNSSAPFGNSKPMGTLSSGRSNSTLTGPISKSPSISNDPFGSSGDTASSDLFPNPATASATDLNPGSGFESGPGEPANLFPDSNSGRSETGTAANDPFQPPLKPAPNGSRTTGTPAAVSGSPFGNERHSTESSSRSTTFASKPGSSDKPGSIDKPGTYTVQEGDTYWNISKKVYGTAKYFQVLADHNLGTIADPQKMQAGVVVQTPDASVLQRKMTTVVRTAPTGLTGSIETSGRADRSVSAGSSGSAGSSSESVAASQPATKTEPSGILFNEQGYPMFRIGETDTLTSIASDHLGRASRWQQVYNMNRDQLQSPDKLQIGMLLKLPADASRVPLVDQTSSLR